MPTGSARTPRPKGGERQRLAPADRERQILEGAIAYFAEAGFSGQTRELSSRLGITQPLLYRYFDSKETLIERMLEEALSGDWKPDWDRVLAERGVPLRERLIAFHLDYLDEVLTYRRVRLVMFSGLKGLGEGMFQHLRARVLDRVLEESRSAFSLPRGTGPWDGELVRALHDSIFFLALRRHVLGWSSTRGMRELVAERVDTFLEGAAAGIARPGREEVPDAEPVGEPRPGGGMVWVAAPDPADAPQGTIAAASLGAMVLEKNEATPQRARD
jgi:AcrR family transcriptional regulator